MVGHGGSSAGSYLADPTSPSPPTVHQLSRLALLRVNHYKRLRDKTSLSCTACTSASGDLQQLNNYNAYDSPT